MDNKKIGLTMVGISVFLAFLLFNLISEANTRSASMNCNPTSQCEKVGTILNASHLSVGLIFSAFSLGIYLLFFNRGDEAVYAALKRLEAEKDKDFREEKFTSLLFALSDAEKLVLLTIKNNEGITQNTLRLKTDLSKAMVSTILKDFAQKGLVKKEEKGKTFAVYLSEAI